jgi:tetratricopeptide (TPR) repeat protein
MKPLRTSGIRLGLHALLFCFAVAAFCFPVAAAAARPQSDSPAAGLGKIRSMAESQHEIVMLLIRKKDFTQAAAEATKIFDMRWPVDQEPLLLKELLYLSNQFTQNGQPAVALDFLKANAKAFRTSQSRIAILKEQGYLHKTLNQNDKAIDCFREAQRLEKQVQP